MVSIRKCDTSTKRLRVERLMTGSPRTRGLPHYKKLAVEAEGRQRSKLHSTLGYKSLSDLPQRHPFGGQRVVRWQPWTVEGRRGRECGNRTATPPLPKALHLCPSRPANGETDSRRTGSGKVMAPTSGKPKVRKKEPTPYHPENTYGHHNGMMRRSAYRVACQSMRNPQKMDPLVERRKSDPYLSPATWTRPGSTL